MKSLFQMCNNECPINTASLKWKTLLVKKCFARNGTYFKGLYTFPKNVSLEKTYFVEKGMFSSIRYTSSRKMHVLQGHATFLEGAPSGKTYCTVWNGYELTHCLNLLLHVYMKTKNRYYLIEMNSDGQLLKGNALFVEGNAAPLFQWTCLFEKPALVMLFLEEKNVFVDHPLKKFTVFSLTFSVWGKDPKLRLF